MLDVFAHRGCPRPGYRAPLAGPPVQRGVQAADREQGHPGRRGALLVSNGTIADSPEAATACRAGVLAADAFYTRRSGWTPRATPICWPRARSCCAPTCELPHAGSRPATIPPHEQHPAEPPPFPGRRVAAGAKPRPGCPAPKTPRPPSARRSASRPGYPHRGRGHRGRGLRRPDRCPRAGPRRRSVCVLEGRDRVGGRVWNHAWVAARSPSAVAPSSAHAGPRDRPGRHAAGSAAFPPTTRVRTSTTPTAKQTRSRHPPHGLRAAGSRHPGGPGHGGGRAGRGGHHRPPRTPPGGPPAPRSGSARPSRPG